MYQYKFVQIKCKKISLKPIEDYHSTVEYNAKQGWRLVQVLNLVMSEGIIEVIFEKEVRE